MADDGSSSSSENEWYKPAFDEKAFEEMDQRFGMTNGRKIARLLSRFKCYNPHGQPKDDEDSDSEEDSLVASEKPNVDAAWAYFEHVTLPRRFVTEDGKAIQKGKGESVKASPGENTVPTKMYHPFFTRDKQLDDFGLGVSMYFKSLKMMSLIMILIGLIHIPNFKFYASESYSINGQDMVDGVLKGSAICTETSWVPCPACRANPKDAQLSELRSTGRVFDTTAEMEDGSQKTLTFALRNHCGDEETIFRAGIVSFIGMVVFVTIIFGLTQKQNKIEVDVDELNATATDFSIQISGIPPDAKDINEWKAYLEQVAHVWLSKNNEGGDKVKARDKHVTCVTVAINNQALVKKLIERRLKKRLIQIEMNESRESVEMLYQGGQLDKSSVIGHSQKVKDMVNDLADLEDEIAKLEKKSYRAVRVFASFETEVGQRAVLSALSVGKIDSDSNDIDALDDDRYAFRRNFVVWATEPDEPPTIRWNDLGVSMSERNKVFLSNIVKTIIIIILAYLLVGGVWKAGGAGFTSFLIAILNIMVPGVLTKLTAKESHTCSGQLQRSLFAKIWIFRWINSAIIIHLVTPFSHSISDGKGLIAAVSSIFIMETILPPTIMSVDPGGNIARHIAAPKCKTQRLMNLKFLGTPADLAERSSSATKLLFMCMFYSALFPGAFFLTALALFVYNHVDKFCLTRVWAPIPAVGSQMSRLNRNLVTPLLLITLSVMNAYLWSGFPYDNICANDHSLPDEYVGTHYIAQVGTEVTVSADDVVYNSCSQDFLGDGVFPPFPHFQEQQWMTPQQETIVQIHAWASVVVILINATYFCLYTDFTEWFQSQFKSTYEPSGEIDGLDFSEVPGDIFPAYIPQVKLPDFNFPLLTCDIKGIPPRLIGWKDPNDTDLEYEDYNLFDDAAEEATMNKENPIFSMAGHWDPPSKEELVGVIE